LPLRDRLQILKRVRAVFADNAEKLADLSAASRERPLAEVLAAEVLPLLEAIRFLEKAAGRLLKPQILGSKLRPMWLAGVRSEVHREALGVVLIIAPSNYPLLLAGVQVLQALAAGNAVLLKPAPGCTAISAAFCNLLVEAGLPMDACILLLESVDEAEAVIEEGVDKVILTGSVGTGRAVLRLAAEKLTAVVAELSGCDAMLVCEDADLQLTTSALLFSLRLNDGATCIAPRRVYVARRVAENLEATLATAVSRLPQVHASPEMSKRLRPLIAGALDGGAEFICGGVDEISVTVPVILSGVGEGSQILQEDVFAPVLSLVIYDSAEEAVELVNRCTYALGASIFSNDLAAAGRLASQLQVGVVTINDLITPTADPRLPFGGRRRSGFGVTRGAEGLLEMTALKVITRTRGKSRRHYKPTGSGEVALFAGYISATHGSSRRNKWRGIQQLWSAMQSLRKGN
jgi:acyl-CoA reductase-like NAD-dependent aldehyde dehydrogenase